MARNLAKKIGKSIGAGVRSQNEFTSELDRLEYSTNAKIIIHYPLSIINYQLSIVSPSLSAEQHSCRSNQNIVQQILKFQNRLEDHQVVFGGKLVGGTLQDGPLDKKPECQQSRSMPSEKKRAEPDNQVGKIEQSEMKFRADVIMRSRGRVTEFLMHPFFPGPWSIGFHKSRFIQDVSDFCAMLSCVLNEQVVVTRERVHLMGKSSQILKE